MFRNACAIFLATAAAVLAVPTIAAAAPLPCAADVPWGPGVTSSFAPAIDPFATGNGPLVSLACDDAGITAVVGTVTDDPTTYIWHTAYRSSDGKTLAHPVELTGTKDATGLWIKGRATVVIPGQETGSAPNYLAAYVCRFVDSAWRCGCDTDGRCSAPANSVFRWSLLAFVGSTGVSGTQTTTGGDRGPRAIDATGGASCALPHATAPIVVTTAGQKIEKLVITSDGTPSITVDAPRVTIENVIIRHKGAPGILATAKASGLVIHNVHIENVGAATAGPFVTPDPEVNVRIDGTAGVTVTNARLLRGSSGVHASACTNVRLTNIQGADFRGSAPRGQFVQWENCRNVSLEHFSVMAPVATAWPEDHVGIIHTSNAYVNDGLIDSNTSIGGAGIQVIHDADEHGVIVENTDILHARYAFLSAFPGNDITYRSVRFGDQICNDPAGRGALCNTTTPWALILAPDSTGITMENAIYQNLCTANALLWDSAACPSCNVREERFTPKNPLNIRFCFD